MAGQNPVVEIVRQINELSGGLLDALLAEEGGGENAAPAEPEGGEAPPAPPGAPA